VRSLIESQTSQCIPIPFRDEDVGLTAIKDIDSELVAIWRELRVAPIRGHRSKWCRFSVGTHPKDRNSVGCASSRKVDERAGRRHCKLGGARTAVDRASLQGRNG